MSFRGLIYGKARVTDFFREKWGRGVSPKGKKINTELLGGHRFEVVMKSSKCISFSGPLVNKTKQNKQINTHTHTKRKRKQK